MWQANCNQVMAEIKTLNLSDQLRAVRANSGVLRKAGMVLFRYSFSGHPPATRAAAIPEQGSTGRGYKAQQGILIVRSRALFRVMQSDSMRI